MNSKESGFVEELILVIIALLIGLLLIGILIIPFAKWEISEDIVSGIVYDNTNNSIITGNTEFKVRASADMYADENTSRTYCLPKDSQYITLVKEAAADKTIRVVVETSKSFKWMMPWDCNDNVKVTKENK